MPDAFSESYLTEEGMTHSLVGGRVDSLSRARICVDVWAYVRSVCKCV